MTLALAESITGGLVGSKLTDIPGSSSYLLLDVVAYSDASKREILGISEMTLKERGAVSAEAVLEMAERVRLIAGSDLGASCTGIAGPTGATKGKPLGLVYMACVGKGYERMERKIFEGNRLHIKEQTCDRLLLMIKEAADAYMDRERRRRDGE
jgi:PncC family amidohydrolase